MPKFFIGDIVTLKTHPFCSQTNEITISGEYIMIPPLMVVVEIIDHSAATSTNDPFDKFKCLWFSTKENQFKENYFTEPDLKKVISDKKKELLEIMPGNLVSLSTMPIELGKKRSFLNTETGQTVTKSTSSVTGLLTFISPVMTVTEVTDFDCNKDKKTSPDVKSKKTYPEKVAKCKWFNAVAEKFSECLIALDALAVIPETSDEMLQLVDETIKAKTYLKLKNTIIRPIQISNRSGSYHLDCFDYVLQRNRTMAFTELIIPEALKNPFVEHAPIFQKKGSAGKKTLELTLTVEALIQKVIDAKIKNYIIIKYKDKLGNTSNRTISRYETLMGNEDFTPTGPLIKYLKAYCHLRRANRNFRLAAILEASELDLSC